MRVLLNNIRYGLMDNKLKGEDLLRQSGATYTIVRPGGLTNGPAGKEKLVIGMLLWHMTPLMLAERLLCLFIVRCRFARRSCAYTQ